MYSTKKIQKTQKIIQRLFKNGKNQPYQATDSQAKLFLAIIDPKIQWLWLSAPTRYGKSEILAMAILYLVAIKKLKVPIVAGSIDKANKIMEYILQHLSDDPVLHEGLLNKDLSDVEKLKVQRTKEALRWGAGGWVYVTSIEMSNTKKQGEGVVGEGGDVVILEEAGLIKSKEQYSKIVRMGEEDKGWGKLIMSGNMIEKSVFEDAYKSDKYIKIRVTLETAVKEGRFSEAYLEQKKEETTSKDWKRYYIPEFPQANEYAYFKPIRYETLPNNLKFYGALDPSLGETIKSSKSGIIILGKDEYNQLYEVESVIEHLLPDEAIRRIMNFPYKFEKFVLEQIQFQKYFLQVIKERAKELGKDIKFDGLTQQANKLVRIESLEPIINNSKIKFKGDNQLWEDMANYPDVEFLDGLDALEMCYRISGVKKPTMGFMDDMI